MTNDTAKTDGDGERAYIRPRRINLPFEPFPLNELANYLPRRRGKKLNRSTVWRWAQRGCRGAAPLETFSIGSMRYVTPDAVKKFLADCDAEAAAGRVCPPSVRIRPARPSAATRALAKRYGIDISGRGGAAAGRTKKEQKA